MSSIKKITKNLEKKYWFYTALCPLVMIGEVVFETVIPFLMAFIIDNGIAARDMQYVLRIGACMILCSVLSLCCGAFGARFGAVASQGFSHNLRRMLFSKVQEFSFSNVDHFSTASLVTRLTTDVNNVQNVYQLVIRICFRAPFMLTAGTVMAFFLNAKLAFVFCISIPVLAVIIAFISIKAYSRFAVMLEKYDRLNTIVQENLIAIRVVKAFVRGERECEKFAESADAVRNAQLNAEKLIIRISPVMQLVVYSTIIAVFWFGGKMVVFGSMKSGELVSFLSYVTQILTSLMMIAMIFVVSGQSFLSASRILFSVAVSTALVLSSRIKILGFFRRARAIQRRCFCPPLKFTPPCPNTVSYFSGNERIKSAASAARHAAAISSSEALAFPHSKFSLIVPLKSTFF